MNREIRIFKSFEEQEQYNFKAMCKTTALERFISLYHMQQVTKKFHPPGNVTRKIIIQKNGHS